MFLQIIVLFLHFILILIYFSNFGIIIKIFVGADKMKKVVLITGAADGIGAATAIEFAKHGFNIVLHYNNSKDQAFKLSNKIKKDFNVDSLPYQADLSNINDAKNLIDFAIKSFGHIDVLVNNAGIAQQKLFTDISFEDWNTMISTNLSSVFYCSKFAVKDMINNKSGVIINVSSIWGETGASCEVHYSAAKAGVIGLTKALAKELGLSNIRVNCVSPGLIDTKMNSHLDSATLNDLINSTPLNKIGEPEDVAKIIYFLSSEDSSFITGQVVGVNGGFLI